MNNNISTTYAYFSSIDFRGNNVLSSYALSSTPFTFKPDVAAKTILIWSFGDDTTSNERMPSKYYKYPGTYTVNLFVYDCYSNALLSNFSKNVEVYPFVPGDVLSVETNTTTNLDITQFKFHPFYVSAFYPIYQPQYSINVSVSGANSNNYFSISSNKYAHLENTNCFYQTISNIGLDVVQYEEIPTVNIDTIPIYGRIVNSDIITETVPVSGSFYIGLSGSKQIYYKDDSVSNKIVLTFKPNNKELLDYQNGNIVEYLNPLGITLSASIVENNDPYELSITSNGLDGELIPVDSFALNDIKYTNVKIPFVVKIKDSDWYSYKNGVMDVDNITFSVLSSTYILTENDLILKDEDSNAIVTEPLGVISPAYYTISSINNTLSSQNHDGSARFYIKFNNIDTLDGISISAVYVSGGNIIAGVSDSFTLYRPNYYDVYKINENNDLSDYYKEIRFQEFLLDDDNMFDDFLGNILGKNSLRNTLSQTILEKITNFNLNHIDLDRQEIFSLNSNMEFLGNEKNTYDSNLLNSPTNLKRILNLASVPINKLLGTPNKFKENFDIKGYSSKDVFGINLGEQIDVLSYTVSTNRPIVALEKFSNTYTLLNTYQPVSSFSISAYPLSTYSNEWGWPLVLPSTFNIENMDKYYLFFEFTDVVDGTISDALIDFYNVYTTAPSSSVLFRNVSNDHIFRSMIIDTLYDSLSVRDA